MLSSFISQITPVVNRHMDAQTKKWIQIGSSVFVVVGGVFYAVYRYNCPLLESPHQIRPYADDADSLSSLFHQLSLDTAQEEPSHVASMYQYYFDKLPKMIFSGTDSFEPQVLAPYMAFPAYSSLKGYSDFHDVGWGKECRALSLAFKSKTYPIGYKIFLPDSMSQAKQVIVHFYGGDSETDKDRIMVSSVNCSNFTSHLVAEGYPFVELFLPDLLQDNSQFRMTPELHTVIHRCINLFYQEITKPGSLDPDLESKGFVDADYILLGASFAGGQSIRHSQLYPSTFSAYISHDGALSPVRDMPIIEGNRKYSNEGVLLPIFHVQDCQEKILLLQNVDDNNVNRENVLKFYQALKKVGKKSLARLCFFNEGNHVELDHWCNKGHFFPLDMKRYLSAIHDFINHSQTNSEIEELIFTRKHLVAEECFVDDVKKRFLAMACRRFLLDMPAMDALEEYWDSVCEPMLRTLLEIEELLNDDKKYRKKVLEFQFEGHSSQTVVQKAVAQHAPKFKEFYQEINHGVTLSLEKIHTDPHVLKHFVKMLLDVKTEPLNKRFILESLYAGNPSLIPAETLSRWVSKVREYKNEFFKQIIDYNEVLNLAVQEVKANPAILTAYQATTTPATRRCLEDDDVSHDLDVRPH